MRPLVPLTGVDQQLFIISFTLCTGPTMHLQYTHTLAKQSDVFYTLISVHTPFATAVSMTY